MDATALGLLEDSASLLDDPRALARRLDEDGYLLIRGFFNRELVLAARRSLLLKLQAEGRLHPDADLMKGRLAERDSLSGFRPDLAADNEELDRVVFGPEILAFYEKLLGGPARHYDFKWLRAVGPGGGTKPHCDIVYMGRGTFNVYTSWIPYGLVDYKLGGLMLLEGSHRKGERLGKYLQMDVDSYCENRPSGQRVKQGESVWEHRMGGSLSSNPVSLRRKLGGRWLIGAFEPGDLLTFGMGMVHASLDNRSDDLARLSSDTRYQLASEPVDERWIGENPVGHGRAGKRGRIC